MINNDECAEVMEDDNQTTSLTANHILYEPERFTTIMCLSQGYLSGVGSLSSNL